MSEDPKNPQPKLKAGAEVVDQCVFCKAQFNAPVATNIEIQCPNPKCGKAFCVLEIK